MDSAARDDAQLLTRSEAAQFLGHAPMTLRRWAKANKGPRYEIVEGRAFYKLGDLRKFADPLALPRKAR